MTESALLRVEGLTRHFGKFAALEDVTLSVEEGKLSALIGPNGAGKTTFYNVVSGRLPPTRGKVHLDGRDVTGLPPHRMVRMGVLRSFQITNLFARLSVIENVLAPLVLHRGSGASWFRRLSARKDLYREAEGILDRVGLLSEAYRQAGTLAYGDKRLVEVAIVLARDPRIILLDEPTAGMNPEETDRMIRLVQELGRTFGTTFFLTEHDMRVVFGAAERIFVLHQGTLLAEGSPGEIRGNRAVREAYLGGSLDA